MAIRVVVAGAAGKMGREVVKALQGRHDVELVGGVGRASAGMDIGEAAGLGRLGIPIGTDVHQVISQTRPDVLVDFTIPSTVADHMEAAINRGVRLVVGTTGLGEAQLAQFAEACEARGVGAIVAPNFAIGAVLMMHFSEIAAMHFPSAEIIEMHHERKIDAPSGTAIKTAEMIAHKMPAHALAAGSETALTGNPVRSPNERQGPSPESQQTSPVARGESVSGVRIHSVRMPGFVAHQEVIFGLPGQTLTIRHDATSRESFMPGVLLSIRRVMDFDGLVYGLESLLIN